jgi:hypothetical protein
LTFDVWLLLPVDILDANEFLQLLSLFAAADVVQEAADVVQRSVGKDLSGKKWP